MNEWIIERSVELDADPERVWRAITDPRELEQWFPDRAEFALAEGAEGSFTWDNHGTGRVRVESFDPPHRLVWSWEGNDGRPLEEYSTRVEWTLTPRPGGGTTLSLRESGFDSPKHFQENQGGWKSELGELVEYLHG